MQWGKWRFRQKRSALSDLAGGMSNPTVSKHFYLSYFAATIIYF